MIQWIIFSTERAGRPWVVFTDERAGRPWVTWVSTRKKHSCIKSRMGAETTSSVRREGSDLLSVTISAPDSFPSEGKPFGAPNVSHPLKGKPFGGRSARKMIQWIIFRAERAGRPWLRIPFPGA